jgi:hypothetical protein
VPSSSEILKIFTWDQITELDDYTLSIKSDFKTLKCDKIHDHHIACIKSYLVKHPLFDIMKGMPLAISIVASQVMSFSLKEIYQ